MLDLNDSILTLIDAGRNRSDAEHRAQKAELDALNFENLEEVKGLTFIRRQGRFYAPDRYPSTMDLAGLDSILAYRRYIASNFDSPDMLFKVNPKSVSLLCKERYGHTVSEPLFASAAAPDDGPSLAEYMSIEKFVLMLKTAFVSNSSLADLMAGIGNVRFEDGMTVADDGISQEVSARAGVHLVEKFRIPPDLTLTRFESFPEIQDKIPARPYFLRLKMIGDTPSAALFGVADPAADLKIRHLIRDYLVERLVKDDALAESYAAGMVLV